MPGILDEKVIFRFSVSKTNVDVTDLCSSVMGWHFGVIDHMPRMTIKCEIISDKCKRAACPFTGVDRAGDGIESDAFAEA
jgi:hypothetical protein